VSVTATNVDPVSTQLKTVLANQQVMQVSISEYDSVFNIYL